MQMDRKQAIKILKSAQTDEYSGTPEELIEAWDMAIRSLETDEAYQLEYEKPYDYKDAYARNYKADMVAMLKELQAEVNTIPINADNSEPFRLGQASAYDKCENLIQEKIDKLKENTDG